VLDMGEWRGKRSNFRLTVLTLVIGFLPLLLGCSHQDLSRPIYYNPLGDFLDEGKPFVTEDKAVELSRAEKFARALARWRAESPLSKETEYEIGPGDILKVSIYALESPDRKSDLYPAVSQKGKISLPLVGEVRCAGLTPLQVQNKLVEAYGKGFIKEPQISVSVQEYRSRSVVVTGAVQSPGIYELSTNTSSVLALLSKAGGLAEDAGDRLIIVRPSAKEEGGSEAKAGDSEGPPTSTISVDLKELIDKGNLSLNVEVRNGDIISVPRAEERYVSILGYVRQPGTFKVKGSSGLDVLHAVAMAGGLTPSARAEKCLLIRRTPGGRKIVRVDLTKIVRGVKPPLLLEADDTLIVGSDVAARFMEVFHGSISAGASLSPAP